MVSEGQLALAFEYRQQLGIPETELRLDPAAIAAEEEARRLEYLQLPFAVEEILFVDDEASLAEAAHRLEGATVLGMDVEWKPTSESGAQSPASLLQVKGVWTGGSISYCKYLLTLPVSFLILALWKESLSM